MGTAIVALIANVLSAVGNFFGYQSKKLDYNNTQTMQNAAEAQAEQDKKDEINNAIEKEDTNAVRNGLS